MRYRLRTLLLFLAIGPQLLAWYVWPRMREEYIAWQWRDAARRAKPVASHGGRLIALDQSCLDIIELQGGLVEVQDKQVRLRDQVARLQNAIDRVAAELTALKPLKMQAPNPLRLAALRFPVEIERAMLHDAMLRN